jgi:phosphoribosyl 1,2-cyclic phosphodiesterase
MASPGRDTVEFGGNTTCLEIRAGDRLLIVDFGSGVRGLGNHLMAADLKNGPVEGDVFVTHTHLDHLIGFPLFAPLFIPTSVFRIYGPRLPEGGGIRDVLELMTSYPFWPVRLDDFAAKLTFTGILETTLDLGGGLKVKSKLLNHPVTALGYRFEYGGASIVAAFDNEPFWNMFADKSDPFYNAEAEAEARRTVESENKRFIEFISGADVLVCDTPYSESEYQNGKRNWGHTSYEGALRNAKAAGVKKLVIFHHEPSRLDKDLREIEKNYFVNAAGVEVITAKEGLVLTV